MSGLELLMTKSERKKTQKVIDEVDWVLKILCCKHNISFDKFTLEEKQLLRVNGICGLFNVLRKEN